MNKTGRGLTRVWIVFIGAIELWLATMLATIVVRWYNENPFDQFDVGYQSLWARSFPLFSFIVAVALAGYAIWLVTRWVICGFSD